MNVFRDEDDTRLNFELVSVLPNWLSFDASQLRFTGRPGATGPALPDDRSGRETAA